MSAITCFLAHDACCERGEELMFRGMADGKPKRDEERHCECVSDVDVPVANETSCANDCKYENKKKEKRDMSNDNADEYYLVEIWKLDGDGDAGRWVTLETSRTSDLHSAECMAQDLSKCFGTTTRVTKVTKRVGCMFNGGVRCKGGKA